MAWLSHNNGGFEATFSAIGFSFQSQRRSANMTMEAENPAQLHTRFQADPYAIFDAEQNLGGLVA